MIYSGFAKRCLCIIGNKNQYLEQNFKPGESLLLSFKKGLNFSLFLPKKGKAIDKNTTRLGEKGFTLFQNKQASMHAPSNITVFLSFCLSFCLSSVYVCIYLHVFLSCSLSLSSSLCLSSLLCLSIHLLF